jgi:hypothetical protein
MYEMQQADIHAYKHEWYVECRNTHTHTHTHLDWDGDCVEGGAISYIGKRNDGRDDRVQPERSSREHV